MAKQPKLEPVHRIILAFDIEGFGGPQRSNPVRSMMRMGLYRLIQEALLHAIGDLSNCSLSDLGDGVLALIRPEVSKTRLVEPFMGDVATGLERYNRQADPSAQIRLRVVLHAGEIVEDPQGFTGEALNVAFRLLDSDAMRAVLSRARAEVGLIVSDYFYDTIIKHGFEGIEPSQYTRVDVQVKETVTKAWISLPSPRAEGELAPEAARDAAAARASSARSVAPAPSKPVQKPIDIQDLPPTCLYVSIGDLDNYLLYSLHNHPVPLRNHLETALLLGRHAVLHCVDPYRSEEVAHLVAEFEEFVKDGSLLFLLSERVTSPRRDYVPYLRYREQEYERSPHGGPDAASYRVHRREVATERAVALLEMSPFALHRGYSATSAFLRRVEADMDVAERMVISERYSASRLRELSLSLRQILELTLLSADGRQQRLLADDARVDRLQDKMADLLSHGVISKHMLFALMREELKLEEDNPFYEVIAARISVIHLLATIGNLSFLEITRSRDRASPYYYQYLLDHLGVLVDCPPPQEIGVELVDELRSLQSWRFFANYHLRLMADLQARLASGDFNPNRRVMFEGSRLITQFDDVRGVLRDAWGA